MWLGRYVSKKETDVQLNQVSHITERDIDLLLLEELTVNIEFQKWLSSRIFDEELFKSHLGVWHSVSDAELGESDLLYIFKSENDEKFAILIENKIDAPPQPKQGFRYYLRGEKGVEDNKWNKFKTCIIAPKRYLASSKHSEEYDFEINYEEIVSFFQSRASKDIRYSYKANMVVEGIEQNRRGYQPEHNSKMTQFVIDYYSFAISQCPELNIQEAKPRPAGSTWVMFYPKSLPKKSDLMHQLTHGLVKVFFNGQAEQFEELKEKYSSVLPVDAEIKVAGKSVAISIKVPKINPLETSFSESKEKIKDALKSLLVLKELVSSA